jgi:hypothetical protein
VSYLSWDIIERLDGKFEVPPGPSDGAIHVDDTVYPTIESVINDLYHAVIEEEMQDGREVRVSLRFKRETP